MKHANTHGKQTRDGEVIAGKRGHGTHQRLTSSAVGTQSGKSLSLMGFVTLRCLRGGLIIVYRKDLYGSA